MKPEDALTKFLTVLPVQSRCREVYGTQMGGGGYSNYLQGPEIIRA